MRIAYLIANFPVLSETFIANEIDRLQERGVDVQIYAFGRPPAADVARLGSAALRLLARTTYISTGEVIATATRRLGYVGRGLGANRELSNVGMARSRTLLMVLRAVAVAHRLRQAGIRHVHAHWPYASRIAHLVRAISGASYSISVHAHEVAHDNGHFPVIFPALSFAAFCNRGAMDYLLPRLSIEDRRRAELIYHGVDLARFAPLPMPEQVRPLQVISAGRLTRTKGFDRLIHSCAGACSAGIDVRLTILGRGPEESALRQVADAAGFSDRLTLPGWVSHDEVQGYMSQAHVFALLADTSFHDGLPNVLLEAMASGRPVIVSPLPAAREAVTDGVEGFVLKGPEDVAGVIQLLRRLQDAPSLLRQLGNAARRRVESDHDACVQIDRLASLFRNHATVSPTV